MIPEVDMAAELHLLFVYGTLRRGAALHHHLRRLGAKFLTKAKVAAEMVDRGRYPGARPACRKGQWVCGELFLLRQPARDLRVLDEVEGFIPEDPERSEFVRATAEAVLNNRARRRVWIYWLRTKPGAARRIASGDYIAGMAQEI